MSKIKFHQMEQRSPEWLAIRVGRIGGSDAISMTTDARMKTQIYKTIAEILTGEEEEFFISQVMQEGIDKEPQAIVEYEKATFNAVERMGYITNDDYELLGLSPDGLVGDVGAIEVKCPLPKQHIKTVMDGVPSENKPQIAQYFLVNTNLEWVDFVSYCPKVTAKPLHIVRVEREDFKAEIAKLEIGYVKFKVKVLAGLKAFGLTLSPNIRIEK